MEKYDNVTMKEYMKKKKEMFDDLGRTKGACMGISCLNCPLSSNRNNNEEGCIELELNNPDKALKIVMEYEPKVDWSKVEVDTKVLIREHPDDNWMPAYFAEYKDRKVYTFINGRTSFTANSKVRSLEYAKLYKGDE